MPKAKDIDARLKEIGKLIEGGASHESFQEELDQLLGTSMEARDEQLEQSWEDGYRRSRRS